MDGNKQSYRPWSTATMNSEIAAAADSRMDLSRHMQVPDKIYVSESHSTPSSHPTPTYRSSAVSTPQTAIPSAAELNRSASGGAADYPETGMSVPRRILMGGDTPSSHTTARPHFPESAMVSEPTHAGAGRQLGTPQRFEDLHYSHALEEQSRPVSHAAASAVALRHNGSSPDHMLSEIDGLKRRVALLEKRLAAGGGGGSGDESPRGGGLLMVMILSFWLFNPVMFYLWRGSR